MTERVLTQVHAVAGAIIEKDGKILLVQEGHGSQEGLWNQPAGWIELTESPLEAVKKEVREETGLDFEPTGLVGIYSLHKKETAHDNGKVAHGIKLIFRGEFTGEPKIMTPDEIQDLKWFTTEEIENMDRSILRDHDIPQEIRDYFAGKNYPLEMVHHFVQG